jgi:hypothetical protein
MKSMRWLVFLTCLPVMTTGCFSSTTLFEGDAGTDTHTDPGGDPGSDPTSDPTGDPIWDPSTDPGSDPIHDPIWDPGSDPGPTCPSPNPAPTGPTVDFIVDDSSWPGWTDIWADCTIDGVDYYLDGEARIQMTCFDVSGVVVPHSVQIFSWPDIWLPLWEGQEVIFRYMADPVWWINEWFRFSYTWDGRMIFGGMKADAINPPVYEDFWYPLSLSPGMAECPLEYQDCFDVRRDAIDVRYSSTYYAGVVDSTIAYVGEWGDYGIHVDTAVTHLNFRCTDVPGQWYSAMFFESSWD